MTPDMIMAAFEQHGLLPREALDAAGQSREAMVPVFLDYIDRLQNAEIDELPDFRATIFILHLIGEWREPRAFRPLAKLLRREPQFVATLLGDAITETVARVLAGVFDEDLQPLFEIILDREADEYVRGEVFDTLAILALQNPETRPHVVTFLTDFFAFNRDEKSEEIWLGWCDCIAALGMAEAEEQVRVAFDSGLITPNYGQFGRFSEHLQATLAAGHPHWFTKFSSNRLITNSIDELDSWFCFSPEYLERQSA